MHGEEVVACSRDFIVDESPPLIGVVREVFPDWHNTTKDITFQWQQDVLQASWPGWSDNTTSIPLQYRYKIGTSPGLDDVVAWTTAGSQTAVVVRDLDLQDGWELTWTVEAYNSANHYSALMSTGVVIDATAPFGNMVNLTGPSGVDGVTFLGSTEVTASWDLFVDEESGVIFYDVEVGLCEDNPLADIVLASRRLTPTTGTVTFSNVQFAQGRLYCVQVTAENEAGLRTTVESTTKFTFDPTPPHSAVVVVGDTLLWSLPHQRNATIVATWNFTDHDVRSVAPMEDYITYEWAVGTAASPELLQAFTHTGSKTQGVASQLAVVERTWYVVTVRATNTAGHSTLHTSLPVLYDPEVPDATSEVLCFSELYPPKSVRVNSTVNCALIPRHLGREVVAYTYDFNVTNGADAVPLVEADVEMLHAGPILDDMPDVSLWFEVTYVAPSHPGKHNLSVTVPGVGGDAEHVMQSPVRWDVASKYADATTSVSCDWDLGAYGDEGIVRHGTTVICTIIVRENDVPGVAVIADISSAAVLGEIVGMRTYDDGGATWFFNYTAPTCGTEDLVRLTMGPNGEDDPDMTNSPIFVHLATQPTVDSELYCASLLHPTTSVRVLEDSYCTLTVRDEQGLAKAVAADFVINVTTGTVSPLVTDDDGFSFTFEYTAPESPPEGGTQFQNNTLQVRLANPWWGQRLITGGHVEMDIAGHADNTSSLACTSQLLLDTEVEYGGEMQCTISMRRDGVVVKAVPADVVVWGTSPGSSVSDVFVADGGVELKFVYTAPTIPGETDDINAAIVVGEGLAPVVFSPITVTLLVVGASRNSILWCETGLLPVTSVRRDTTNVCSITMIDRDGDPVKGDVLAFTLDARFGDVSIARPAAGGRVAELDYEPPAVGFVDDVHAFLTLTDETLVDGIVDLDVVDWPDGTSRLECTSAERPNDAVRAGGRVNCTIYVRLEGSIVKAVPADFNITTLPPVPISDVDVMEGGERLQFEFFAPETMGLNDMNVTVVLTSPLPGDVASGGAIVQGTQHFHVMHLPDDTSSVTCTRYEAVPPDGSAVYVDEGTVLVAEYELVDCQVTARANGLPVKAFVYDFAPATINGTVSPYTTFHISGFKVGFAYMAPDVDQLGSDLLSIGVAATGAEVAGSPVPLRVFHHDIPTPYVRCDTDRAPRSSTVAFGLAWCTVYFGTPQSVVDGALGLQPRIAVTVPAGDGEILQDRPPWWFRSGDEAGLGYPFVYRAPAGPGRFHFTITTTLSEGDVAGSPVPIDVAGDMDPGKSIFSCEYGVAFAAVGYVLRDMPVTCGIASMDAAGVPVQALFTDFVITTNGAVTTPMWTADGGLTFNFTITTPIEGTQFEARVFEAGTSLILSGPLVLAELTDEDAPIWTGEQPQVLYSDKATVTMSLQLDEPCRVYVDTARPWFRVSSNY